MRHVVVRRALLALAAPTGRESWCWRGGLRFSREADDAVAVLLRRRRENGLYRDLGYTSIAAYAQQAHQMGRSKTRALLVIAGAMTQLPALATAMKSGAVPWTKAREVVWVATPATVSDWLTHASHVSNRELENIVRHSRPGDTLDKAVERREEADDLRTFSVRKPLSGPA